jgi:diguanylate cyclase (GGDEF)-like protein
MQTTQTSGSTPRSYEFLFDRLLPAGLLETAGAAIVTAARMHGDRGALRTEALTALRTWARQGGCVEVPGVRPGVRSFRLRSGRDWIHLVEPEPEQQASGPRPTPGNVDEAFPPPQAQVAPAAREDLDPIAGLDTAFDRVAARETSAAPPNETPSEAAVVPADAQSLVPFLDLASIENQLEPLGDRLRRILTQIEAHLPGSQARLVCLQSEAAEALGDGVIRILERARADEIPHFRAALERGETQFATSAPVGSDPSSGRIAAAVPLHVGGAPWGVLQITWPQGSIASLHELARLLAPLARLVTIAIQNQTAIEQLVFVDPLTGVYNRGFYERQIALEIERANRTNQKFGLLVLDVDDFKAINDRHGHRAGDAVLSQLAREVRGRMRKIDLMFRYGGEEFVVLLPGADLEEAQRTGERLRLIVSAQRYPIEGLAEPLRVTVSIGGAVYPDQSRTKTGIFHAADTALYRAKSEGKNRVAF